MPKLVLVRDGDRDIKHRTAIMSLDGQMVRRLQYGETFSMDISVGRHVLEGKNELGTRREISFEAVEGGTVRVMVDAMPRGCMAVMAWIMPPVPVIEMRVEEGDE
ncbi:MAG: hypothetical protein IH945_02340 [Armatimonadetes bacterium]|nr:hypothetical protein [Armatimonadota bacterium]